MAARRLVLNGLTAEVAGEAREPREPPERASPEFYHELELYRQLLALPAKPNATSPVTPHATSPVTPFVTSNATPHVTPRRARTPDPPPPARTFRGELQYLDT